MLEVSDSLDHTFLTKGKFSVNLQPCNVAEVVAEVVEMMTFQTSLKQVEIDCRVWTDLNKGQYSID